MVLVCLELSKEYFYSYQQNAHVKLHKNLTMTKLHLQFDFEMSQLGQIVDPFEMHFQAYFSALTF